MIYLLTENPVKTSFSYYISHYFSLFQFINKYYLNVCLVSLKYCEQYWFSFFSQRVLFTLYYLALQCTTMNKEINTYFYCDELRWPAFHLHKNNLNYHQSYSHSFISIYVRWITILPNIIMLTVYFGVSMGFYTSTARSILSINRN